MEEKKSQGVEAIRKRVTTTMDCRVHAGLREMKMLTLEEAVVEDNEKVVRPIVLRF